MSFPGKRSVSCWLLLVCVFYFTCLHGSNASSLWTAYVNISFVNPQTNKTVWEDEESGLYGQNSFITNANGLVVLPDPLHGCSEHTVYDVPEYAKKKWIALVQRGNGCTFTEKITEAVFRGAVAVVIFNYPTLGNEVIEMYHPGAKDTVAIMVGNSKGMEIVQLIHGGAQVNLTIKVGNQHGPWMSHYSVFFISISFFIVTATVGYFIFYSARRLHTSRALNRRQKQLKADAKKAIGQLEVRTLKPGDKVNLRDSCAVCIEVYKLNDVMRILTCNHLFHKTCIDPWLLEHRTCPMCKCDILKALGIEQPDDEEASEPVQMDERVLEEENPIPANSVLRMEVLPHYDNLTFATEEDAPRHDNLQQVKT
ncbi:E3 ubiquitin-protein ligase RNF128-like isoform X1 [Acipenser oxyrinchus oxyrinchus]|uniref:E3 ubiquitin-protein ligase RNF128-like isoform X1 n=1 Tax=Acipenser oxyrinchus oxyrinchus TaxID=40147 RepID=A0AAD8FR69_ACIOX|nr:E3 ubiquitin-protein ligase RNF128-like isoform X1 [Acipenser oxyrinchus oxyrinchus]